MFSWPFSAGVAQWRAERRLERTLYIIGEGRCLARIPRLMYLTRMPHIRVNIDDEACAEIMRRYQLATKREAINFALRTLEDYH